MKNIVVGSGFSGSVIAERISSILGEKVVVIDKRNEIGGNSYSYTDDETGICVHKYGSHIFHTNYDEIWKYVNKFSKFNSYQHKVVFKTNEINTFMPINLKTINDVYKSNFSPEDAMDVIKKEIAECNILTKNNLEEKAISLIGRRLYECCVYGYTTKQWNKDPKLLPEKIINRLPIRFNYNTNYFNDKYQGIPTSGYTEIISKMLDSKNIELKLNTRFNDIKGEITKDTRIFYSGMIDEFFDYKFGALEWRSLEFKWKTFDVDDYQGTSVINYGDIDIPYTRIHEFKHYQMERSEIFNIGKTVVCYEYPKDWKIGEEAYYPIESESNLNLLKNTNSMQRQKHQM